MTEAASPLGPGSTFAGCRIDCVAGRGGMGVVFKATQTALQRTVALKAVAPELAEDVSFRQRFQRESHIAASIEHPNVIPVYEAGEFQDTLYLIMRWVDGTDLRALVASEGRLEPERAVLLLRPVASALTAAHRRGLVHRDIKPANVLIARGDGAQEEHVYLTDFGIARRGKGDSLTRTGVLVGTIDYLAPERIEGGRGDASSDIYSFGCMLFEALAGHVPFDRATDLTKMYAHMNDPVPRAGDEVPGIPEQLDAIIATAMAKEPTERFASAGELTSALDGALADIEAGGAETRALPARETDAVAAPRADPETGAVTLMRAPAAALVNDPAPATVAPVRQRRPWLVIAAALTALIVVAIIVVIATSGGGGAAPARTTGTPLASKLSGSPLVTLGSAVTLPFAPTAMAAQGDGVWVAGAANVAQIAAGRVQKTLAVAGTPKGIAVDPDGQVWVSGLKPNNVTVLEQHTDIPTGPDPGALTITDHAAWVLTAGANATRIPLTTKKPERIPLPAPGIAVGQAYGRVWIACADGSVRAFGTGGKPDPVAVPSIRSVVGIAPAFGVWFLSSDGSLTRVNPQRSAEVNVGGELQYRGYVHQGDAGANAVGLGSAGENGDVVWALSRGERTLSAIGSHDPDTARTVAKFRFGAEPGQLAVGAGVVWVSLPSAKLVYPVSTG